MSIGMLRDSGPIAATGYSSCSKQQDSSHDKIHMRVFPLASVVGTDRLGFGRRTDLEASELFFGKAMTMLSAFCSISLLAPKGCASLLCR